MKKWASPIFAISSVYFFSLSYAAPPAPDIPPPSAIESLVKSYVDENFIQEELPPPEKCDKYSEKLMFAYDWNVVIVKVGQYDAARKLLPVEAKVTVRCGPVQPLSPSSGKGDPSDFPLKSETPIDFQMVSDPKHPEQWKVHEVTLWKSKQKVIEQ